MRIAVWALAALVSATVLGGEGQADLDRRFERIRDAVEARLDGVPKDELVADAAAARAALAVEKAELLLSRYRPGAYRDRLAQEEMEKAERYLADPASLTPAPEPGFHELAYISEIDLSAQPYALHVPSAHDGETPLPLLVFLHGYASDLNKVNWIDYMYSPTLERVCEELGFALLLPYGRSNTEFMGIGESDVLKTIRLVKELLPIDERRVVLSGASMGGSGAYTIACHYPHLFAGVFTVTGRVDYYRWMRVPKERLPRFKQSQIDMDYARELVGNLQHVPVFIGHGEYDFLLEIGQSRLMERLMEDRGQDVKLVEFEGASHYIWSRTFEHSALLERLKAWRAPEEPAKVRYRTYSVKYPRAYWVRVNGIVTWGRPADVTAAIKGNRIEVETENVSALTLSPPESLVDPDEPVAVVHNGRTLGEFRFRGKPVRITADPLPDLSGPRKTPALSGPAREAYDGPFIIVEPTTQAPDLPRQREKARRLAREWEGYAQGPARMVRDTDITEEHVRDHNLILAGGPETNAYLARIADKLPIQFEEDAYRVGDRTFPREGAGLVMIYPNPENPERYVLIREGTQWGKEIQINHKLVFLPDFIVYTDEIDRDGTMFETNRALCAGYFDSAWRLDPASTWVE